MTCLKKGKHSIVVYIGEVCFDGQDGATQKGSHVSFFGRSVLLEKPNISSC